MRVADGIGQDALFEFAPEIRERRRMGGGGGGEARAYGLGRRAPDGALGGVAQPIDHHIEEIVGDGPEAVPILGIERSGRFGIAHGLSLASPECVEPRRAGVKFARQGRMRRWG